MRKNEKKSIFSLGPNGPILQIFLVVQYLVGSLKMPSDGSNNLIFLDRVKEHCEQQHRCHHHHHHHQSSSYKKINTINTSSCLHLLFLTFQTITIPNITMGDHHQHHHEHHHHVHHPHDRHHCLYSWRGMTVVLSSGRLPLTRGGNDNNNKGVPRIY